MCSVCLMTPCHPSCPNAPEPKAAFYCRKCGEPILPEDEYARIDGDEYCEKCIDDMPFCELVPLLGGEWKTADGGKKVTCTGCGREISHGEEYGEFDGSALCEGCIDEVPYSELVERMNGEWNMASEEDIYDGYLIHFREAGLGTSEAIERLPHGVIIGEVTLAGCVPIDELLETKYGTEREKAFGDWRKGWKRYGWILEDPVKYDVPIPARGMQGIWEWGGQA